MGPDRGQRPISISRPRRGAEPGHRDGGDRAERRSGAGTGTLSETAALGELGRTEQGDRPDAPGRRDASRDGWASKAQQDFQLDPAGLEISQAAAGFAAKKH